MGAGKATGVAREYQELCRDVLVRTFGGTPYAGDGLDVPFEAAGTTFHVDVALNGGGIHSDGVVLAECRNTGAPQKQSAVAAFAFEAERIREALRKPVAAFFMAREEPQLGAIKLQSGELDLGGVVVVRGTALTSAQVMCLEYDREREKKLRRHLMFAETGKYSMKPGKVSMRVTRNDGSVETSRDESDN